jgi:hypothetical protein
MKTGTNIRHLIRSSTYVAHDLTSNVCQRKAQVETPQLRGRLLWRMLIAADEKTDTAFSVIQ